MLCTRLELRGAEVPGSRLTLIFSESWNEGGCNASEKLVSFRMKHHCGSLNTILSLNSFS